MFCGPLRGTHVGNYRAGKLKVFPPTNNFGERNIRCQSFGSGYTLLE
jgi:hypothetical protein